MSSNYFYFHSDDPYEPRSYNIKGEAYMTAIRGFMAQFSTITTHFEPALWRFWPDDLSSPLSSWEPHDFALQQVGIVPVLEVADNELCVRVDSTSSLGVRFHYFSHIPSLYLTDTAELTTVARLAYGSLIALLVVDWVHVSWAQHTWATVQAVDVLDDRTTLNSRRRKQPAHGGIHIP